jgi:hypothetical protein
VPIPDSISRSFSSGLQQPSLAAVCHWLGGPQGVVGPNDDYGPTTDYVGLVGPSIGSTPTPGSPISSGNTPNIAAIYAGLTNAGLFTLQADVDAMCGPSTDQAQLSALVNTLAGLVTALHVNFPSL